MMQMKCILHVGTVQSFLTDFFLSDLKRPRKDYRFKPTEFY